MNIRPETSIASLDFSRRTTNSLERAGITTYSQLKSLLDSNFDFHEIRGLGEMCIKEILCFKHISDIDSSSKSDASQFSYYDEYSFGEYVNSFETDSRNWQLLVDYCNGGREATLERIGDKYGLTRERVRQLINKCEDRIKTAIRDGLIRKDVVRLIDEAADKRTEVSMLPVKDEVFTRPGLAYLMAHISPERYKIIRNPKLNGEWFTKTSDHVEDMLEMLIDRLKNGHEPLLASVVTNLFSMPEEMLMSIDGISEENGYVTIGNKNEVKKDRYTLINEYLESIYRPASVAELIEKTGLTEPQVRGALQDKNRYVNVGKSIYDLDGRDYEGLSVNALATNILAAVNRPLKIDQIIEYVQRYSSVTESGISYNIIYADNIERDGEYFRLKGWDKDGVQKLKANNSYLLTLDEAIFDIVSSSDNNVLMDSTAVKQLLEDSYKDAVSTNESTIKTTLANLAKEHLISRVGVNTGCYVRSKDLPQAEIDRRIAAIAAKYELGLFLKERIDKVVEIRYKTDRKNSDKRWRQIEVAGQNGRYIFAKNSYSPGTVIKYLKERVVEFREADDSEPKQIKLDIPTPAVVPIPQSKGWYEDIKTRIDKLGNTFTLNQVYGFEDVLSKMHSENSNIKAKIRQQLQVLRDNYVIEFLQPGIYRKLGSFAKPVAASSSSQTGNKLVTGKEYSNAVIMETFKVSGQGGMRKSNRTNSLVLIANHRPGNPYEDKWDGDILNYTGMGLRGAQSINYAQNKTLAESKTNGVTVYLFESYADNSYTFRGVVELAGEPFFTVEEDADGSVRTVLKFPIRIKK